MKRRIILLTIGIIICSIILVLGGIYMIFYKNKVSEIKSLKEFHYRVTDGRNMYGIIEYNINYEDNLYTLKSRLNGFDEDEAVIVVPEEGTINKIIDVLNKYNVASWDGFSKSSKSVLDGKSFEFKVVTKENEKIYCTGYMSYPKNYKKVISELENIINEENNKVYTSLLSYDVYKGLDIENVSKLVINRATEGGIETEEVTNKEDIINTYNTISNIKTTIETKMTCDDNSIIYKFIMNDGKEYKIEKECDWFVIDGVRYHFINK